MVERDWINRQADGVVTEYIVTQVSKALTRAEACGCANCIAEYNAWLTWVEPEPGCLDEYRIHSRSKSKKRRY